MIPGRRSHDVRPMTPTAVPSERRPSASEEASRPSIQNLTNLASEGGNGRTESAGHSVGDVVSRRLAFLGVGDPRSSSTTSFLPPRSHSRVDSNGTRDSPSNMSSSTLVSATKQHASPSKGSMGRTYDSKLVSREMHRLGNFAHLNPTPFTHATSSSTSLPQSASSMNPAPSDNPWGALHIHVLPLFNGEALRVPVEDLNTLVKRHIQSVVSAVPSKAMATLEHDTSALISSGMVTLNAKLIGIDDDKLVSRVVEIWGFFWDQVLPYVEGVLLPLQTDPLLSSLYRGNKSHRPSDAAGQNSNGQLPSHMVSSPQIDVRTVAIRAFRDQIIFPIFSRLGSCLTALGSQDLGLDKNYQQPRLQQMLLVLVSQGRERSVSLSLTDPDPQPSAPEAAVQHLLRAVRLPLAQVSANPAQTSSGRTPSFLSDNQPRDRRGRIAEKPKNIKTSLGDPGSSARQRPMLGRRNANGNLGHEDYALVEDDEFGGEETPRIKKGGWAGVVQEIYFDEEREREREREFLESLRSPDIENENHGDHRGSIGGWGLGNPHEEDATKKHVMEDEDDELDWDQAQSVVERMKVYENGHGERR